MDKTQALLERDLRTCPDLFAYHISGQKFKAYNYQRLIAREVVNAVNSGNGRIIINIPSRHGKSQFCSHWLPTWFIDCFPSLTVGLTSYGAELAENFGRGVRNEFENNPLLLTRLRQDSKAANRWNTPDGGGMLAVGVGGSILGRGINLGIIDDPHKDWNEANNPTYRRRVIDWFGSTYYSRLEPDATIVLLMQRMHPEDLTGWLLAEHKDPWKLFRLPALAEKNDLMGRPEGAALCPQRYDEDALKRIRGGMSAQAWEAMFQQRPEAFGIGTAYRYRPEIHEDKSIELRPDLPLQISFDFNVNPGVHLLVGQYDRRTDQFTACHEIFGPRLKTRGAMESFGHLYRKIQAAGKRWTTIQVYGDRSGNTENTTTATTDYQIIAEQLREMGLTPQMRVPDANPPIKARLETFNDALQDANGDVHYKVHPQNCPRLVRDLKFVKEDEDGLIDKTDDDYTHPSDAEGYRIFVQRPIHRAERAPARVHMMS
jgi:hypothetical protein